MKTRHALLLLLATACGSEDAPQTANGAEAGGAPVYVEASTHPGAHYVEPGYGWTVLHCVDEGQRDGSVVEFCADASHLYQSVDGLLCGPIVDGQKHMDGTGHVITADAGCRMDTVGFPRWVRAH